MLNLKKKIMKKKITLIVFALLTVSTLTVSAQWSTGVDLYSSYVWRGLKFGSGPALQPTVKYTAGGFTIGAWGSYCFSTNEAAEADIFASYAVSLGEKASLTLAVTDYYFPGTAYLDGDSHYFEPMVTVGIGKLSLAGAYMTNAEDIYFEAGFAAGPVTIFAGAGNGAYTSDAEFNVCNVGLKSTKEIKLSETFSIPVTGSVVLNPSTEQFHIAVGISL
jgi:uncharacterized protein (TIGR02001 family)